MTPDIATSLGIFVGLVRSTIFVIVAVIAIVAVLDWLARKRHISPFNPIARFLRTTVDPLIAPMERRVVQAGGLPSAAPWWTLVAAVVLGIIVILVVESLAGAIVVAWINLNSGPRGLYRLLVQVTFFVLRTALLVRVIASWLPISPYSPWIRWSFSLTEPFLRPLRGFIPTLGMIDLTPLIAYFVLGLLQSFFMRF
jgi:YggT family protein